MTRQRLALAGAVVRALKPSLAGLSTAALCFVTPQRRGAHGPCLPRKAQPKHALGSGRAGPSKIQASSRNWMKRRTFSHS